MNWVHTEVSIDTSLSKVWAFISDFGNAPKWGLWDEGKWEQTSQGPVGIGATFQSWERLLGKKFVYDWRVTEWEPDKKFALWTPKLASGEPGTFVVTLEPAEGKTRMTVDVGFELTGLRKLIRPAFSWAVRREGWASKVRDALGTERTFAGLG